MNLHRSTIFLIVSLVIIAAYVGFSLAFPQVQKSIYNAFIDLREYALTNGLWGMFVFALAANATILINVPYSSVAVLLAGLGLNPFSIALVAGVGAMAGELTGYFIGFGGGKLFARGKETKFIALRDVLLRRKRLTPLLIFTFAALPIPDDILLIPLGVIHYPFLKMILPMTLGKIIQNLYFALIGRYSLGLVSQQIGEGSGFGIGIVSLILLLGAMYFVLRIDWERLFGRWTGGQHSDTIGS